VPPLGVLAYQSTIKPYWDVRERLLDDLRNEELTNPVTGVISVEMAELSKEIAKLKDKPKEVGEKIDQAVKKFGLTRITMPTALDRFDLEKDPALKKVREEFLSSRFNSADQSQVFASFLLLELKGVYDPKEFHRNSGDVYLVWQTEFIKAREPTSLAQIRPKVVEAWYFQEARTLARKQAEEWSRQAKKLKDSESPALVIKRLREESKEEGFTLVQVARLISQTAQMARGGRDYSPYVIEKGKIPNARPDMVERLVKALTEKGDSTVVSDLPAKVFYVAVLEERDNQTNLAGFLDVLSKTPFEDNLWNTHLLAAKQREYEKLVLKQLRTEAGAKLKEDGEYDLPEGIRVRGVETGGEGD
jgi:hypothetical protein